MREVEVLESGQNEMEGKEAKSGSTPTLAVDKPSLKFKDVRLLDRSHSLLVETIVQGKWKRLGLIWRQERTEVDLLQSTYPKSR